MRPSAGEGCPTRKAQVALLPVSALSSHGMLGAQLPQVLPFPAETLHTLAFVDRTLSYGSEAGCTRRFARSNVPRLVRRLSSRSACAFCFFCRCNAMLSGYCARSRRSGPGVLSGPDGRVRPVSGGLVEEPVRGRRLEKYYGAPDATAQSVHPYPPRFASSR